MKLRPRPSGGAVVLGGRVIAQGGFFAYTIGPALVLGDAAYNDLIVGVTIVLLFGIAPVSAFQLHLLRLPEASRSLREARLKSIELASGCGLVGAGISLAFGTPWSLVIWLTLGGLASCVPSLVASLHALDGRFARSALADAASGVFFVLLSFVLLIASADVVVWAAVFALVWALAACAVSIGPLAVRVTVSPQRSFGSMRRVLLDARAMIAIGVAAMAFNRADYLTLSIVGAESETTRYAVATRVVGPILIALGSLNNSLYVQQINLRDDPAGLDTLTRRTSRRVGALAILIVPGPVLTVFLLGLVSETFAAKALVLPTALLALATVPFAFAVPYSFGLAATGRERTWLAIISAATIADLIGVVAFGHRGAVAIASLWLITQLFVWLTVIQMWHSRRAAG